jgi:hypothetical protein
MGLRPVRIDCRDFTDGSKTHLTVTNRAVTTEPSPSAIGGQSLMAVTNASPETSSSGRFSGNMRPAHRPLARIHERDRMISASTMPPSLHSKVMDNLAQVAWSGSGCGSTSERLGFLVGTRSNRHRFDGDLKLRARCYRCVALGCKPWCFLGRLVEPTRIRPERMR